MLVAMIVAVMVAVIAAGAMHVWLSVRRRRLLANFSAVLTAVLTAV